MDPLQRLLAERARERLIVDFVHRLDLGEPASVGELFTEDGTWEWPPPGDGRRIEGREALRAYFGSRPGGPIPSGPPVQVGHYEDAFRRLDGDWLITSRTLHLPFGGPTPTATAQAAEGCR
ncbi:nuclear transport factor 2 family protein [Streptomyces sp. CA-142005]|uniref:nuclear transport factor 2 family protein n=1 Tax=Streptomyces sp. CA-142005 TaxID=3240052 RepID=UPI003D8F0840